MGRGVSQLFLCCSSGNESHTTQSNMGHFCPSSRNHPLFGGVATTCPGSAWLCCASLAGPRPHDRDLFVQISVKFVRIMISTRGLLVRCPPRRFARKMTDKRSSSKSTRAFSEMNELNKLGLGEKKLIIYVEQGATAPISRAELWKTGHKRKTGEYISINAAVLTSKINEFSSQESQSAETVSQGRADILASVLGQDIRAKERGELGGRRRSTPAAGEASEPRFASGVQIREGKIVAVVFIRPSFLHG
ncbi:hypothetical protein KSP39_PZI022133 [Platanthera zijinensis]|uniref:Uncharacterized protein n=1 Tax=Platanthera zijinensis TaxID=2320716 RepID=A0AAP0AX29_9ASPA